MKAPETLEHVVPDLPNAVVVQNGQYAFLNTDIGRP